MKFHVERTFQFKERIIREGSTIEVLKADVEKEIAKGKHPKQVGVFLSGLLNYCLPADEETAAFVSKGMGVKVEVVEEENDEESPDEITSLRVAFDEIGAAYDRRWGLQKLRNELLKAKKTRGQ